MLSTEDVWTGYRANLQSLLRSKVANDSDAEDLLQEILIKTHANLHTVKDEGSLRSWLMKIANRAIIDFYRANRTATEELSEQGQWWDEHAVEADEGLAKCVRPFIQALPQDAAELLDAIDLQGRSQKEYAQSLDISYSTLKTRVQRARRDLRGVMTRCCTLSIDGRGKVIDFESRSSGPCKVC